MLKNETRTPLSSYTKFNSTGTSAFDVRSKTDLTALKRKEEDTSEHAAQAGKSHP